jgi:branched-chain amino acid transport system substrate-binding protein
MLREGTLKNVRTWVQMFGALGLVAGGLALGIGSEAAAAGAASAPSGKPYIIGVVSSDTTAVVAGVSKDVPITTAAWVSWANSHGGVNGHPVKIIEKNDEDSPAVAMTIVQTMVQTDDVVAIVDDSQVDSTWADYVTAAKIPVFCGNATGDGFTCNSDPDFIPAGSTVLTTVWGSSKAAQLAGAKSFYVMYDSAAPAAKQALPLQEQFTTQVGMKFAGSVGISGTATDYTAPCVAAKSATADSVFPEGASAVEVASSCSRQNYKPQWILAQAAFSGRYRTAPALNKAIGPMGVFPFFTDNTPATHAFSQALKKYSPNFDSFLAPYDASSTWAALQLFSAAAAKMPTDQTPAGITAGIYKLPKGFTLGGLIPPETLVQGKKHTNPCTFIVQIKNTKYVTPFGQKTFCQAGVTAQ